MHPSLLAPPRPRLAPKFRITNPRLTPSNKNATAMAVTKGQAAPFQAALALPNCRPPRCLHAKAKLHVLSWTNSLTWLFFCICSLLLPCPVQLGLALSSRGFLLLGSSLYSFDLTTLFGGYSFVFCQFSLALCRTLHVPNTAEQQCLSRYYRFCILCKRHVLILSTHRLDSIASPETHKNASFPTPFAAQRCRFPVHRRPKAAKFVIKRLKPCLARTPARGILGNPFTWAQRDPTVRCGLIGRTESRQRSIIIIRKGRAWMGRLSLNYRPLHGVVTSRSRCEYEYRY